MEAVSNSTDCFLPLLLLEKGTLFISAALIVLCSFASFFYPVYLFSL